MDKELIYLGSSVYRIKNIKKKTQSKIFCKFKVDDLIKFSTLIESPGRGSRGVYVTRITITNISQGTSNKKSLSELSNIIYNIFELEEVLDEY